MIGSRAVGLLQNVARKQLPVNLQQFRRNHGDWHYRSVPTPAKWASRCATGCAVVAWWWFYWNLYHGWPHVIGLYDGKFLPDPRKYTDEELGIPPLEEE